MTKYYTPKKHGYTYVKLSKKATKEQKELAQSIIETIEKEEEPSLSELITEMCELAKKIGEMNKN